MKITRRQLSQIAGIVEDEAAERRRLHTEMYSRRRNSLLVEAEDIQPDGIGQALQGELEQDILDMGSSVRVDFDKVLFKSLAKLIAATGGEKVSGPVLQDDLEDFDADGMIELQQSFAIDLAGLLEKYVSDVAALAVHAKLPGSYEP